MALTQCKLARPRDSVLGVVGVMTLLGREPNSTKCHGPRLFTERTLE